MATFDQRGQTVSYQYNAAGDINFGQVQNQAQLVAQLAALKAELTRAKEAGVVNAEQVMEAQQQIDGAAAEAKKPQPDKRTIAGFLDGAAKVLGGIAALGSLVAAIRKAIEVAGVLF